VERTRIAFLDKEPAAPAGGSLYRALRDDVAFRFVAVAPGDAYEVVHADGAPEGKGVVLIDPFDVPPDAAAAFLADWHAARAALASHRGYQGTRLYRAVGPAEFRFVAFSRWSSPLAFARAVGGPTVPHAPLYLLLPG
jgi:hypothetical protein